MTDPRILLEKDPATHIARLTLNNPDRKNCYDPEMRRAMAVDMEDVANDDDMKVLLVRGSGVFSAGGSARSRSRSAGCVSVPLPTFRPWRPARSTRRGSRT